MHTSQVVKQRLYSWMHDGCGREVLPYAREGCECAHRSECSGHASVTIFFSKIRVSSRGIYIKFT